MQSSRVWSADRKLWLKTAQNVRRLPSIIPIIEGKSRFSFVWTKKSSSAAGETFEGGTFRIADYPGFGRSRAGTPEFLDLFLSTARILNRVSSSINDLVLIVGETSMR